MSKYGSPYGSPTWLKSIRDMADIACILTVALAVVSIFSMVVGTAASYITCGSRGKTLGAQTQYKILSGCYVERDGQWIQWDTYRVMEPTR